MGLTLFRRVCYCVATQGIANNKNTTMVQRRTTIVGSGGLSPKIDIGKLFRFLANGKSAIVRRFFVSLVIVSLVFGPVAPAIPALAQEAEQPASSGDPASPVNVVTDVPTDGSPDFFGSPGTPPEDSTAQVSDPLPSPDSATPDPGSVPVADGDADALQDAAPLSGDVSDKTEASTEPTAAVNGESPAIAAAVTGPDGASSQSVVLGSFGQDRLKIDKNTGAMAVSYPIVVPPGRNGLQPDLALTYNSQGSERGSIFGEGWSISIP